jgi:DNA-binding GntR family transcriptional regulator
MDQTLPIGDDGHTVSPATTQRIADQLRRAILAGEIAPGDHIRQQEIAARFGVSRLPVREALRILEAEGLTQHETNKGARVCRLDMQELQVVYQIRERLEPLALIQSMPHLGDGDVKALRGMHDAICANSDLNAFLALDRAFHLRSYAGSPTRQINAMVTRLWNSTQHYRRAFVRLYGQDRMWVVNAEHALLLDAIERGDPVDAEAHLAGHIRRTRTELAQHPEIFGTDEDRHESLPIAE